MGNEEADGAGTRLIGATRRSILQLVFRRIAVLIGAGSLLGVPFALAMQGLLGSVVYQEAANDLVFLSGVVAAIVVLVGLLACWQPARRALGVDPAAALSPE